MGAQQVKPLFVSLASHIREIQASMLPSCLSAHAPGKALGSLPCTEETRKEFQDPGSDLAAAVVGVVNQLMKDFSLSLSFPLTPPSLPPSLSAFPAKTFLSNLQVITTANHIGDGR